MSPLPQPAVPVNNTVVTPLPQVQPNLVQPQVPVTPVVGNVVPAPGVVTPQQPVTTSQPAPVTPQVQVVAPVVEPATTLPVEVTPQEAQKRIDRMYARMQQAKRERDALKNPAPILPTPAVTPVPASVPAPVDEFGEETPAAVTPVEPTMTRADVTQLLDQNKHLESFKQSEARVYLRHPEALNADGSYNMNDPFMQKWTEIGQRNPELVDMANGPELAEAQAEKELGSTYRQGRVDEATHLQNTTVNNQTVMSTVPMPNRAVNAQLSPAQEKAAKQYGLTNEQYVAQSSSIQIPQRSWGLNKEGR